MMKLNHADVSGVQLGFPPQAAITMTAYVEVRNPNSYDVAVRAVRGTVMLAEKYPLPIDYRTTGEGVWLPSDKTTELRVPIAIPVQLALQLMREAYTQPSIPFRLMGKADVTATRSLKIEKDDYSLDEKGIITREQMDGAIRSVFPFGGMGGG